MLITVFFQIQEDSMIEMLIELNTNSLLAIVPSIYYHEYEGKIPKALPRY